LFASVPWWPRKRFPAVDHRGGRTQLFAAQEIQSCPFVFSERDRLYSEDRIKTPLKRVNFDPSPGGGRNPQARGKVGYEPISWDEAIEIVAGELKRVKDAHAPLRSRR